MWECGPLEKGAGRTLWRWRLTVSPARRVLLGTGHFGVEQGQWYIVTQEAQYMWNRQRLRQVRFKVLQTKRNVLHLYGVVSGKCEVMALAASLW